MTQILRRQKPDTELLSLSEDSSVSFHYCLIDFLLARGSLIEILSYIKGNKKDHVVNRSFV